MKNRLKDIIDFVEKEDYNSLTWKQIGINLNMNEKTARNCFKQLGLKKVQVSNKNIEKFDTITNLINKGYSQKEISKELNQTVRQVTVYTNGQGLVNPNRKQKHIDLDKDQYQVLIGSLLGDGHIDDKGRLRIKHSCKQVKYLSYKEKILGQDIVKVFKTNTLRYDKRTNKIYCGCTIDSYCYDVFSEFRLNWYHTKKTIYKPDFNNIEALGLAIWFMDDGCKYNKGMLLATDCFTYNDVFYMRKLLFNKFNILFEINKYNRLYLKKDEYKKFHKLIEQYIIPEMRYKLQDI